MFPVIQVGTANEPERPAEARDACKKRNPIGAIIRAAGNRWAMQMHGGTLCVVLSLLAGCQQDMADQPHLEPLEASDFFADGKSARPLVEGTVARGHLRVDQAFFEGRQNGQLVDSFPLPAVAERLRLSGDDQQVMTEILARGQERFNIFCAACHDRTGHGRGMVVQRGFPAPPSLHNDRLRSAPLGTLYRVITEGFGRMSAYADQIPPTDRWTIVAYVRALQFSQHADVTQLPKSDRDKLPTARTAP